MMPQVVRWHGIEAVQSVLFFPAFSAGRLRGGKLVRCGARRAGHWEFIETARYSILLNSLKSATARRRFLETPFLIRWFFHRRSSRFLRGG